jgi:hypothetical protein
MPYFTVRGPVSLGSGLDPSTDLWIAAVVAAGGTVSGDATSGRRKVVNDLIVALKAATLWTRLDRLWIFAAENQPSALVDMVALDLATVSGHAPTFTADNGYAGNGSSTYVDTTFNPATQSTNFTLNSGHIAVWDNTNRAQDAALAACGVLIYVLFSSSLTAACCCALIVPMDQRMEFLVHRRGSFLHNAKMSALYMDIGMGLLLIARFLALQVPSYHH